MENISIVILAAGKGTRMRTDLPKVLHTLRGKPMIEYTIEVASKLHPRKLIVVVGYKKDDVIQATSKFHNLEYAIQKEQLGTGHAVKTTQPLLKDFQGNILILLGDVPLVSLDALTNLLHFHADKNAACTVLTAVLDNPFNYGRIVRCDDGSIQKIVEEKDATDDEKQIKEINSGIMVFNGRYLFDVLDQIKNNNAKGEYYLTDAIEILVNQGYKVYAFTATNSREVLGVNTPEQLMELESLLG
ncbi:MAG: UDP-N-acetylglucosamine pyrophosphorylase [Candidatus Dojkabacteria bacterium]|nr:MAG: UDP-N-acetylglucosamine pyrophosphorylase [Candidatus Dojkabacteria bacterium]